MKLKISVLLLFMVACSCKQLVESKTERDGEPDVFSVSESNNDMNEAMKMARSNLHLFIEALERDNPKHEYFAVKQKFSALENDEHIWVGNIIIENEELSGVVNNVPVYTTKVKLGDTIKINKERISDWMYFDDGVVRGGYTIRVIRESLSDKEKEAFDYENGLIFDD
ncbi:DUF2314 domain-containing protein [uncultured Croceitalea sp.]|uniref:YegJ family protein n=1 Tax=uncultured Croceitalea sp. TaxID=1798908 RepID=UPI0033056BEC